MSDHRYGSKNLCGMRLTRLTSAGAPVPGSGNGYISTAPMKLAATVNTTKGATQNLLNGCGTSCQSFTDPDTVDSIGLSMDLCQLDFDMLELMTGATLVLGSASHPRGLLDPAVGATPNPVALEVWTQAWDGGQQAVSPLVGTATYIHYVYPSTKWIISNQTDTNGILTVTITGVGSENAHLTVNGPYDDWPTEIAAAGGCPRIRNRFYDAGPPAVVADGYITVTSAAS